MKQIIYCIGILFLSISCSEIEWGGNANDHFFLKVDKSVMPVFVKGNTKSKVFLIYLHDGPGYTSLDAYQEKDSPLTDLEEDFAVVYWDQRCAGTSQGTFDYKQLELNQYTADLEKLIILLKNQYANDISIFLLGHGWGGALGVQFLVKGENQQGIKGWVDIAGSHSTQDMMISGKALILETGNKKIAKEKDVDKWKEIVEEVSSIEIKSGDNYLDFKELTEDCEKLMRESDDIDSPISTIGFGDYFFSPLDVHAIHLNRGRSLSALKDDLVKLNLSEELGDITIPTLMIGGEYDFLVPPLYMNGIVGLYGGENIRLEIIERAGHFVQWHQPDKFYELVYGFVEENK